MPRTANRPKICRSIFFCTTSSKVGRFWKFKRLNTLIFYWEFKYLIKMFHFSVQFCPVIQLFHFKLIHGTFLEPLPNILCFLSQAHLKGSLRPSLWCYLCLGPLLSLIKDRPIFQLFRAHSHYLKVYKPRLYFRGSFQSIFFSIQNQRTMFGTFGA